MTDKNHPLDDTFDMDSDLDFEDKMFKIEIPENPTLEDITRIALEAYKESMDDLVHTKPQYRARTLEICNRFLETAKDALAKKETHKLAKEKFEKDNGKEEKPKNNRNSLLYNINDKRKEHK